MGDKEKSKHQRLSDLRSQLDQLGYTAPGKASSRVFSADELRRTLKRPKQQLTSPPPPSKSASPIVYRRDLPRRTAGDSSGPRLPATPVQLDAAVDGVETTHGSKGKAYVVTTCVADLDDACALNSTFEEKLATPGSSLCQQLTPVCDPETVEPADVVFMDIESTGLGSSPLFLIGAMVWSPNGFEARQYLARNYAEEAAVIGMFAELCASKKLLVTFNGKSFDLPFVRARAAVNKVPLSFDPAHFDLLHVCRRIWKDALPDCKLQTLERCVCKRVRRGDIPGSEIPDAYHQYVRTDNAALIVEVLKHNMLDLVTLADLMTHFP